MKLVGSLCRKHLCSNICAPIRKVGLLNHHDIKFIYSLFL